MCPWHCDQNAPGHVAQMGQSHPTTESILPILKSECLSDTGDNCLRQACLSGCRYTGHSKVVPLTSRQGCGINLPGWPGCLLVAPMIGGAS